MAGLPRIRSISRLMAFLCWIPIVMIPALILYGDEERAKLSVEKETEADGAVSYGFSYSGGGFQLSADRKDEIFSSWESFFFPMVRSLPGFALFVGFLHIRRLFRIYSGGEFFTVAAARHLKWFSLSLLIFGLLRPLGYFEKGLTDRFQEADTLQYSLEIPDAGISFLFLGLSLLVISWVMGEAARLAEDNRSIV